MVQTINREQATLMFKYTSWSPKCTPTAYIRDGARLSTFTGPKTVLCSLSTVKLPILLLDQLNLYQSSPKDWCLLHRLLYITATYYMVKVLNLYIIELNSFKCFAYN